MLGTKAPRGRASARVVVLAAAAAAASFSALATIGGRQLADPWWPRVTVSKKEAERLARAHSEDKVFCASKGSVAALFCAEDLPDRRSAITAEMLSAMDACTEHEISKPSAEVAEVLMQGKELLYSSWNPFMKQKVYAALAGAPS